MRGKKILEIATDVVVDKYMLLAVLRKLPEDARLESVSLDYTRGEDIMQLKFSSDEWPAASPAALTPFWNISIHTDEVEVERRAVAVKGRSAQPQHKPGSCICDFAYTGLKQHKHECPLFKK